MPELDRRDLVAGAALVAAGAALISADALAQTPPAIAPQALPFNPAQIPGLSERLLTSHHDNNYAGAVTRLGAIQAQLAALDFATAPGFLINGLKREELLATNSVILHEFYFASLGRGGGRPGSALARRIESDFGSHDRWRAEFVAMGKALGGGSGWVLLTWSARIGRLVNQWAFDHTMALADGRALIALDMYEHAYHMDFGARAAAYVDAYMAALDWRNADRIFARAIAEPH
jgi:Fe-Mn family superoxide dismutase